MSRGPGRRKLNPRCDSSNWGEETPRSNRTPRTFAIPSRSSTAGRLEKCSRRSRTRLPNGARLDRVDSNASGSRSRATTSRLGASSSRRFEWPPRPTVASTRTPPLSKAGRRSRVTSSERTGLCSTNPCLSTEGSRRDRHHAEYPPYRRAGKRKKDDAVTDLARQPVLWKCPQDPCHPISLSIRNRDLLRIAPGRLPRRARVPAPSARGSRARRG
jgi:hypothetical protein